MKWMNFLLTVVLMGALFSLKSQQTGFYREPSWKPRAILPYEDAVNQTIWPAAPKTDAHFEDPLFDSTRLSHLPAPGVHPRVLITPDDLEKIRIKLKTGEKASPAFKTMWERVETGKGAFYALVTNNQELGRKLAVDLIKKAKRLDGKIAEMNNSEDRDNLWNLERSIVANGHPDPPIEIWELLNYDYLHAWMTKEERTLINQVIAKVIEHRISNYLAYPEHFMINNHQGFGMEYIRLMLLIEGEQGFDQKLFDASARQLKAMLDWYLDKDGMCYESIKGWLNVSALMAVALRKRELLKHSHLMAKMNYFLSAIRWEDGAWKIRDEMRASAFHVIWMMHYFHPKDPRIDFLYQSCFSTHPFLTSAKEKWPDPVGICQELLLLFTDEEQLQSNQVPKDWTLQKNIDQLQLPITWQDSSRGYVETRNSWKKEDLHLGFVCKQDFYYGGHEGSENNRITLWKDGVNWIVDQNMLATKATFLQNMLTIDGMGCHWPPAPGNWLGVKDTPMGMVAAGDGKIGYSYTKIMQVHPLYFPSAKTPYLAPFAEGNFDLSRDLQIAFQPSTIKWADGYAHTDYGPWSGETRLIESYKPFNPVEQAFRTVQMARGKYPYVLVLDDVKKDDLKHRYDWNACVPLEAELVESFTPEVVFQNTEPSDNRMDELIVAAHSIPKDSKTGKPLLKKGEPLCLFKILRRNSDYGFPVPSLQKFQGYALIDIPSIAVSPEFRVLVYPFLYGDPLPVCTWNEDGSSLTIKIKDQTDVYDFGKTEGGRTVLTQTREGIEVLKSGATPARPEPQIRRETYRYTDYQYTQKEQKIPEYLFKDSLEVRFNRPDYPAAIHYTLNGKEPGSEDPVYTGPLVLHQTTLVKARLIDPQWTQGSISSQVASVQLVKQSLAKGRSTTIKNRQKGLHLALYEINTKLYNDKGFFQASLNMMPDLSTYKSDTNAIVGKVELPLFSPKHALEEQSKGFYEFNGYFHAIRAGIYRFDLNSCGPVAMDIANKNVINETGVFHQQQDHRKGEVALDTGWHQFRLVITDPLYWNANSLPAMPVKLSCAIDEGNYEEVPASAFCYMSNTTNQLFSKKNELIKAVLPDFKLEPGMVLDYYDRTGKRRNSDFMEVESGESFQTDWVSNIVPSSNRNVVKVYSGYLFAPSSGTYQFEMPYRSGDNVRLGGVQASCQSQIRIGNSVILQRGVFGPNYCGRVSLSAGWHPISIRVGTGDAQGYLVYPDGQRVGLTGKLIFRPLRVQVQLQGQPSNQSVYEIYKVEKLNLSVFAPRDWQIRYTLDGSEPIATSILYQGSILVEKSCILKAAAFSDDKKQTLPVNVLISRTRQPERASMGKFLFDGKLPGDVYPSSLKKYSVWLDPEGSAVAGRKGAALKIAEQQEMVKSVDINVARGSSIKVGFKLFDMKMNANALSIALWFKSDQSNGKIFSKEGINAFGKSYKTISCEMVNQRIQVNPGKIIGGKIIPGEWQHLVITADETSIKIFQNGEMVAQGPGSIDIITDAFDFFTSHPAVVEGIELFNRTLGADDVKQLFAETNKLNP